MVAFICDQTFSFALKALSTTEAEYVALSSALRDVIPHMDLFTGSQHISEKKNKAN